VDDPGLLVAGVGSALSEPAAVGDEAVVGGDVPAGRGVLEEAVLAVLPAQAPSVISSPTAASAVAAVVCRVTRRGRHVGCACIIGAPRPATNIPRVKPV
jgi:hypothetical protein